jgi:hypothetical protein
MIVEQIAASASIPERRRFGRINIFEPRVCRINLTHSLESWTDQGILVNISLGGLYFVCDRQPPFEKNDICYLTFDTPSLGAQQHFLKFHVSVVRTGTSSLSFPKFALALRIISDPIYHPPEETDYRELIPIDKLRIMYQYYALNKKAHEIITNTPDIRTDKINNLKEYLEKDAYNIQSKKVTQRLIKNIFMDGMAVFKT